MCYGEGICNLMSWFRLYVRYTFPNVEINRPFDTGVCLVTECRNCSTGYPRLLSHSPPETPRLRQLGTNIGRPESNNTSHPGPSEYWLLAVYWLLFTGIIIKTGTVVWQTCMQSENLVVKTKYVTESEEIPPRLWMIKSWVLCPVSLAQGENYYRPSRYFREQVTVFWDVTHCRLSDICRRFGGIYCLHAQVRCTQYVLLIRLVICCDCMTSHRGRRWSSYHR